MATFNKFNAFVAAAANGKHNLSTNALKVMLTNSIPLAANAIKTDITEIAAGGGYTAGGLAMAITSSTQTAGTYTLVPTGDVVLTATGAVATFQYVVLYNDTATNKDLIGWYDKGSTVTLANTETFTMTVGASLISIV